MRLVFFFSSRRRHTRFDCDWSSDVCSSDLDAHDPRPALPQAQSTEFRAVNRNPIPKFADSLVANSQKSCQCFFRESDKSRKLSYNARARAHPSVATLLSELCLPYAPRLENSMLQKPRLNSSARSNRFKRLAGDGR